jgi:YbbR domain-containing protein
LPTPAQALWRAAGEGAVIRLLTAHWELKLVALVIAIALWLYTNGQVRHERTILIRLPDHAVQSLPDGYRVTDIQPQAREFSVKISLPESMLHSLTSDAVVPRLVIRADALSSGTQSFPITNRILGLDDDIRILRVDPESVQEIRVLFAAVTTDYLPVEVPRLIGVPDGLEAAVVLDQTRVRVSSTREEIERLRQGNQKLIPEPIVLADIDPRLQQVRAERLKLTIRSTQITILDQVTATITLRPVAATRQLMSLPVHVLVSNEVLSRCAIEVNPPVVTITVHGAENLLHALHPDIDLTAYINLTHLPQPGVPLEVPVSVIAPGQLSCDPVTVRVTVTILQPANPPAVAPNPQVIPRHAEGHQP